MMLREKIGLSVLLVCLSWKAAYSVAPSRVVEIETMVVEVGQDIVLPCGYSWAQEYPEWFFVTWFWTPLNSNDRIKMYYHEPYDENITVLYHPGEEFIANMNDTIEIMKIRANDSGTYECQVEGWRTRKQKIIVYTLGSGPRLRIYNATDEADGYSRTRFHCEADRVAPEPDLFIVVEGHTLSTYIMTQKTDREEWTISGDAVLDISQVHVGAMVECLVVFKEEEIYLNTHQHYMANFTYTTLDVTIDDFVVPRYVRAGQNAELKCRYTLQQTEPEWFDVRWWWKPDTTPNQTRLIYHRPSCNHTFTPAIVHVPGDRIIIKPNDTIEIVNLQPRDSGIYECAVSYWESRKENLIVYTPGSGPKLRYTEVIDWTTGKRSINLTCDVSGVAPEPELVLMVNLDEISVQETVRWNNEGEWRVVVNATLDASQVPIGDCSCDIIYTKGDGLYIEHERFADVITYTARDINITVIKEPPVALKFGGNLLLECGVDLMEEPEDFLVTWLWTPMDAAKETKLIYSRNKSDKYITMKHDPGLKPTRVFVNGSIEMTYMRSSDSGTFECRVTGRNGNWNNRIHTYLFYGPGGGPTINVSEVITNETTGHKTVKLYCEVYHAKPEPELFITIDGEPIHVEKGKLDYLSWDAEWDYYVNATLDASEIRNNSIVRCELEFKKTDIYIDHDPYISNITFYCTEDCNHPASPIEPNPDPTSDLDVSFTNVSVPSAVKVGENAVLECQYKLHQEQKDNFTFKWYWLPEGPTSDWHRRLIYHRTLRYYMETYTPWEKLYPGDKILIKPNDTIEIVNMQLSDSGTYECEINNGHDTNVREQIQTTRKRKLIVYTPGTGPQLNVTFVKDEVTDEQMAELTCAADHVAPEPELYIYVDGEKIPTSEVERLENGNEWRVMVTANVYLHTSVLRNGSTVSCKLVYHQVKGFHIDDEPYVNIIYKEPENLPSLAERTTSVSFLCLTICMSLLFYLKSLA